MNGECEKFSNSKTEEKATSKKQHRLSFRSCLHETSNDFVSVAVLSLVTVYMRPA